MNAKKGIILIAVLGVLVLLLDQAEITGHSTAIGGRITSVNLTGTNNVSNWAGLYGQVTENASSSTNVSLNVTRGTTKETNISLNCINDEIYASSAPVSVWGAVSAGAPSMINSYLNLDTQHPESASKMFTQNKTYTVSTTNLSLPTTYTLSENNGTFDQGILNNSGTFVMVTHNVSDKEGFDNSNHDYQLLLPTKDEYVAYYFFSDCSTTNPSQITIHSPKTADDFFRKRARLNVSVATSAKIWYTLDNGTNRTLCHACTGAVTFLDDLEFTDHTLAVYANDSVGNLSFITHTFTMTLDSDGDGEVDNLDSDNDGDSIPDVNDTWDGFVHNIQSDIPHINITIDDSYNLSQDFEGRLSVNISNNTHTFLEFFFNFSGSNVCTVANITLTTENITEDEGWAMARGVCLGDGEKKTVYVNDVDKAKNSLCIKDRELTSITEITEDCSGAGEVRLACPGTSSGYICTVVDGRYRVEGLSHSGAIETMDAAQSSAAPSPSLTRVRPKPAAAAGGEVTPEEPTPEEPTPEQVREAPSEPAPIDFQQIKIGLFPPAPRLELQFFLFTRFIVFITLVITLLILLKRRWRNKDAERRTLFSSRKNGNEHL